MKPTDRQERYLKQRQHGYGITEAARRAGIGRSTVSVWRHNKPFRRHDDQVGKGAPSEQPDLEPVGIQEFVTSPRYLDKAKTLRPVVLEALKAIQAGDFHTVLAGGAVGIGKTYLLQILFCYELYKLSTLESPHAQFSLDPDTPLLLVVQNRTEKLSQQNDFSGIKAMLDSSSYFQKAFPPAKKSTLGRMYFPNRIEIWAESGDFRSILGMSPVVALLDEVNYMDTVERSTKAADGGSLVKFV